MQSWINFWNIIFWVTFCSFLFASTSFIKLLFLSELTWIVLYNYTLLVASINDDLTVLSIAFFILGFAGLEFSVGFLLILIFKKILKLDELDKQHTQTKLSYFDFEGNKNLVNQLKQKVL